MSEKTSDPVCLSGNPPRGLKGLAACRPQLFGSICAVFATLIWSFNFLFGRALADAIQPMTLVTLRGFLAVLLFTPFAFGRFRRDWTAIRAHLPFFALAGFIGITIPNTCIYTAAHTSEALNLSIIAISTPLFVLILARIFFCEALSRTRIFGLAVIICGIMLLLSRGNLAVLMALNFQKGDLIMFGNVFGFATYTVMMRKTPKGVSSLSIMYVLLIFAAVFAAPGAIWEHLNGAQIHFSWKLAGGLLYTAAGASILSYFTWNLAVSYAGSARTSIIYYLLPVFSGLEAAFFLGEPITLVHILSMALIVSGLFIAIHVKKTV